MLEAIETPTFEDECFEKTEAFEELIECHADALRNAALRYTGHESDADDLVQEVWLRAFKAFAQYTPGTNSRAWLLTILKNTFFSRYQRTQLERSFIWPEEKRFELTAGDAERASSPPDLLSDLPEAIRKAVDCLPEDYRRVISLVDVSGLSYRQAATAIERPIGTVMSRLSRARGLLRELLRGAYPEFAAEPQSRLGSRMSRVLSPSGRRPRAA